MEWVVCQMQRIIMFLVIAMNVGSAPKSMMIEWREKGIHTCHENQVLKEVDQGTNLRQGLQQTLPTMEVISTQLLYLEVEDLAK